MHVVRSLIVLIIVCNCSRDTCGENISFRFEREIRSCIVEVPRASSPEAGYPLLIILHGRNESGRFIRFRSDGGRFFDKAGFVTAYPNGSGTFRYNWNDFEKEVAYLNALMDTLTAIFEIDTTRIYLAGFSQGGQLTVRTACKYPGRIAAVALVASCIDSAFVSTGCTMKETVPLLALNSTRDPACQFDSFTYKGKWYNSVEAGITAWAKRMGCGTEPDTVITRPRAVMKRWKNYSGAETVSWATDEGGHAWPGGKGLLYLPHFKPATCIDANALLGEFFLRNSRQR